MVIHGNSIKIYLKVKIKIYLKAKNYFKNKKNSLGMVNMGQTKARLLC